MSDRSAIVTGSSRGIGRGIALALGATGWRVVVNYAGRADAAERTRREVVEAGGEAVAIRADVSRDEDRRRLLGEATEAFGPISLLVNNAGITSPGRRDLLEATEEAFDRVMAVNLKGPFFLSQLVARHMIERGGEVGGGSGGEGPAAMRAIVNICSLSAYAASTDRGDYCMARAAMSMMTKLWAARLAGEGVYVYELRPGIIETDMTAAPAVREKYDRLIGEGGLLPIGRWGRPEDVGRAVAALAAGALPYSTGEAINIDGGFHIRRL